MLIKKIYIYFVTFGFSGSLPSNVWVFGDNEFLSFPHAQPCSFKNVFDEILDDYNIKKEESVCDFGVFN